MAGDEAHEIALVHFEVGVLEERIVQTTNAGLLGHDAGQKHVLKFDHFGGVRSDHSRQIRYGVSMDQVGRSGGEVRIDLAGVR